MAIPDYQTLMLPVLRLVGGEGWQSQLKDAQWAAKAMHIEMFTPLSADTPAPEMNLPQMQRSPTPMPGTAPHITRHKPLLNDS